MRYLRLLSNELNIIVKYLRLLHGILYEHFLLLPSSRRLISQNYFHVANAAGVNTNWIITKFRSVTERLLFHLISLAAFEHIQS